MTCPEDINGSLSETSPLLARIESRSDRGDVEPADSQKPSDGETPVVDEPTTGELLLVMSSIWVGCFLAALDSTLVATLSAPILASFHSLSLLSWLASAYLIAQAAFQPLSGKLTVSTPPSCSTMCHELCIFFDPVS